MRNNTNEEFGIQEYAHTGFIVVSVFMVVVVLPIVIVVVFMVIKRRRIHKNRLHRWRDYVDSVRIKNGNQFADTNSIVDAEPVHIVDAIPA